MPSCLVHTGDESVTLSAATVKRLLDRGDGDAALLYLARHPNRSVSAQELYEAVWQQPMGADPHAVRMTISRLKQKLGGEDARVTVNSYRSSGYRLEEQ